MLTILKLHACTHLPEVPEVTGMEVLVAHKVLIGHLGSFPPDKLQLIVRDCKLVALNRTGWRSNENTVGYGSLRSRKKWQCSCNVNQRFLDVPNGEESSSIDYL